MQGVAIVRLFEHHVAELEQQLSMGYQRGSFQNTILLRQGEMKKVESQYRRHEEGTLLEDRERNVRERWTSLARC